MTKQLSYKMICYFLEDSGSDEGFTLIELLVVIIILGVLAAIALPNFVNQAGRARETELKNTTGTLNRAQQAYHFERQTFGTSLSSLGVSIPAQYITNSDTLIAGVSSSAADVIPANSKAKNDGTRAYSGRIVHNGGEYQQILCQSNDVASQLSAPTGAVNALTCTGVSAPID